MYADAEAAGIWVNSADDPAHCSFILPAVHRDGAVTVSVSTGGLSPALASWLRDRIADWRSLGLWQLLGRPGRLWRRAAQRLGGLGDLLEARCRASAVRDLQRTVASPRYWAGHRVLLDAAPAARTVCSVRTCSRTELCVDNATGTDSRRDRRELPSRARRRHGLFVPFRRDSASVLHVAIPERCKLHLHAGQLHQCMTTASGSRGPVPRGDT